MVCQFCKKKFIRTRTYDEYNKIKNEFEQNICVHLTDLENEYIWTKLLEFDAMVLRPSENPRTGIIEKQPIEICKLCYNTLFSK